MKHLQTDRKTGALPQSRANHWYNAVRPSSILRLLEVAAHIAASINRPTLNYVSWQFESFRNVFSPSVITAPHPVSPKSCAPLTVVSRHRGSSSRRGLPNYPSSSSYFSHQNSRHSRLSPTLLVISNVRGNHTHAHT